MDRLTIDEAIEHCKEVVRDNREDAKYAIENELHDAVIKTCTKCAEEHEQLAEWLEELKELRKFKETYQKGMDYSYATFMYNKAIDDFEDKILSYLKHDDYGNAMDILVIADELKKESAE